MVRPQALPVQVLMLFVPRSLYIQALAAMQNAPESDLLSYYQISGKGQPPPANPL
jgi:hypothetical protein